MKHYLLKCIYEGQEIAFIDVLISEKKNLKSLHDTLIKALDFSGDQLAAFYEINEDFEIISEIGVADFMNHEKQMDNILISEVFSEEGDQLLYTYDFLNEYKFTIECIEVTSSNEDVLSVTKKYGDLPKEKQSTITNEDAESILLNAIMGDEFEDDDMDSFDEEDFESLDDYEGLI